MKNICISKPNTWTPGENIIGLDIDGNYLIKKGSSVSTIITTAFISLILSNRKILANEKFQKEYLKNIYNLIIDIRDSNISLPNININEITSGVFNPDGLLNLILFKLDKFINNLGKLNDSYNESINENNKSGNQKIVLSNNSFFYNDTISKNVLTYFNYTYQDNISTASNLSYNQNKRQNGKIMLFNNVMDFSLNYLSNFTISSFNKENNNKVFYSTKQPVLVPLVFYQSNIQYQEETIFKYPFEIKIIRSKRKIDISQCLKVTN